MKPLKQFIVICCFFFRWLSYVDVIVALHFAILLPFLHGVSRLMIMIIVSIDSLNCAATKIINDIQLFESMSTVKYVLGCH